MMNTFQIFNITPPQNNFIQSISEFNIASSSRKMSGRCQKGKGKKKDFRPMKQLLSKFKVTSNCPYRLACLKESKICHSF